MLKATLSLQSVSPLSGIAESGDLVIAQIVFIAEFAD